MHAPRRLLACLLAFLVAVPMALVEPELAEALTVDPMANSGTYDVHGDFILVGNGSLTANGGDIYNYYSPVNLFSGNTNPNVPNDYYRMTNADTDGRSGTFNSTSATYTIPKGASVVAAKVVWSGNTGYAKGWGGVTCSAASDRPASLPGSPATSNPSTQQVQVTLNGATSSYAPSNYTDDTSQTTLGSGQSYYYSANADVTDQFSGVVGDGTAKTVTVANVWAPQGYGCYGGWALELVYDFGSYDNTQPDASQRRMVYMFDGYERKFSSDPTTNIQLTGLQPQGAGAKMGVVAFEGDASITGDFIRYSDTTSPMTNIPNPVTGSTTNYFVGVANGSTPFANYSGSTFYNASVNAQTSSLGNVVAGDSTLTLQLGTSGDSYLLSNTIVSVPVADIKITKTAANGEQDAAYAPGSEPSFRITVYNSGSVAITRIRVTDAMVPGCARDTTQMATDIARTYPTGNGYIPPGGSVQYTCTAPATSTSYTNNAKVYGETGTGIPVTGSNDSRVLMGTWQVTKAPKYPDVPAGTIPTWVFTVRNTGTADIFNVVVTDPNAPACSTTVPLVKAGTTYTYECQGPSAITGHTTNGFTATGSAQATSTSTIKVPLSAGVDASSPTAPAVEASAVTLSKTVDKATASVGEKVTFTFVVRNTGSSTLNTVQLTDPEFASCNQANIGPLAAGASRTVTCTVTPFASATSATLTNRATVVATPPSGTTVSASSQVDVDNKALAVAKTGRTTDTNGNGVLDAGDTVAYGFTVTNTGSTPLTAVGVADPRLAGATITCTPTTLAPGAAATCTPNRSYTLTQADVDAGTLVNTATGTGTAPDGTTTSGTATLTLTPVQQPAITLAKTAAPTTVNAVGQVVTYTFALANSGNTTLTGVTLADPLAGLSTPTCRTAAGATVTLPASLAPGARLTCTATRTTTQADLDDGAVTNTATAQGTSPKGTVVRTTSSATVTATQTPRLTFAKTADRTSFSTVGEVATYSFTVTNTGNVTLTGAAITDPMTRLANRRCTPTMPATLAPGASLTCTSQLTVTQADIDGGAIVNTATGTANPPSGQAIQATSSFVLSPKPAPALSLVKTASRASVTDAGQVVTYSLAASNNGNTTINNVTIADALPGLVMGACTPAQGSSLAPGAKMTCSASYTATQADVDAGRITNTATARGTDSHGQALTATDSRTVTATPAPAVQLTKSASPAVVNTVGQVVTYTFVVRNSGNVTLSRLALSDPIGGLSAITCTPTALGASLAPGASTTCTATRATTQADLDAGAVVNSATATGTTPAGGTVSGPGTATVTASQNPAMTTAKTASPGTVTTAGTAVKYTITVRNSGNVSLRNLRVGDPRLASLSCAPTALGGSLAAGATTTCTGTYTATQNDVNAGTINNTATVTLTPPAGSDLVQTPTAVVTTTQTPSLATTKTGSSTTFTRAGEVLTYTVTTRNTGNLTLTGVTVSDPMFPSTSPLSCTPAAPATLQPGEALTCTGSHTVTQAEVDAGRLVNTATARGTTPTGSQVGSTGSWTATATAAPDATLTKTANPATISAPGRVVTYTLALTNTGNVSLSNATISDPRIGTPTSCTPALGSRLAPGATMTCTGTYTSTQADVDAGSILNTATAAGTPPSGPALSRSASTVVGVSQSATLTMVKTATPNRVQSVGQVVNYTFRVTNTGNVTASAIAIADPMPGLSAITCPTTTLAPGASTTCTATRTTTQADLNQASAKVTNTATLTAQDPKGSAIAPVSSTAEVAITQSPSLALAKSANPTVVEAVGVPVAYTLTATNTGNVDAANVRITDNLIPGTALTCTPAAGSTLAPGARMTCTGTRTSTQADLDAGRVVNTASVTGTAPNGTAIAPASAQATVTSTQKPSVALTKTPSRTTASAVGEALTYSFQVTNTGNVTLGSLKLADPLKGLSGISCPATTLAPGASTTCTARYSTTQADLDAGSIPNTATVSTERPGGDPASSADDVTATSSALVTIEQRPGLETTKVADQASYRSLGRTINYTITGTNTGNVSLANVQVSDPLLPATDLTCTPETGGTLAPGARITCTGSHTITQADLDRGSLANTATITGTTPGGARLSRSATVTLPAVAQPALAFTKTPSPATVTTLGDVVTYAFQVTNTGNVTMDRIAVQDPMTGLGEVTCPATRLAPGASTTCTAGYTVTQADLDRGSITNTATVRATDPAGTAQTRTATATTAVTQTASLALDKKTSRTSISAVGDVVPYVFTVTNTGNVTASTISVTDPLPNLSPISCPATTLAPGASMDCTASYAVRQADLDAGQVSNTATVRGTSPGGTAIRPATDTVKVAAEQDPRRTFTKTATPATVTRAGEVVTYTFEVHNTGNVTINNVTVSDPMYQRGMTTTSCNVYAPDGTTVLRACAGAISLQPGEYKRRVASYTVTQADIDSGTIPNTATLVSSAPDGTALEPLRSSFVVGAAQQPSMTLTKQADTATYSAVGQVVTYSMALTNTGNVSLRDARITDPLAGLSALECTPEAGSTLAPRETMRCTATRPATQADLDARTLTNTATATAVDPSGTTLERTAQRTLTAVLTPSLTVGKSATPSTVRSLGEEVTYTFVVRNTGNATLNQGEIADPIDGLSAITCSAYSLAPGTETTCTATRKVTQADLDRGSIANTATASAADPAGTRVSGSGSTTVRVAQDARLALTKTADRTELPAVGQQVRYTFRVSNPGNVTMGSIAVADPLPNLSPVSCPDTTLAPGASMDCTASYTVRQADLDAGSLTNTATATGTSSTGIPATARDTVTLDATQQPSSTFTKSADRSVVDTVGDVVTYTFRFTNTGNVTLGNAVVVDPMTTRGLSTLNCTVRDSATDAVLRPGAGAVSVSPGEYKLCTATYQVSQGDLNAGSIANTATVTPSRPGGTLMDPQSSSVLVTARQAPAATFTKAADLTGYTRAGQVVNYTFVLTNTGNVDLTNPTINDPMPGLGTPVCTPTAGTTLAPRASMRCTASHTITQAEVDAGTLPNTATATATPPGGEPLVRSASVVLTATRTPSIGLTKTASPNPVTAAGQEVTYTFQVTNTGNVTLSGITVADPLPGLSAPTCQATTLAPGASTTCTATLTTTQAHVDAGQVNNRATASGTDPAGTTVTREATAVLRVAQSPRLSLAKSPSTPTVSRAGDQVEYRFVVTNTGNVTVNDLSLSDPMFTPAAVSCPVSSLAPGASTTCTRTWDVTQAQVDAGTFTNTAVVTGTTATGLAVPVASDSATVTARPAPSWTFTKTADHEEVTRIGETVVYTLTVTNTGNVTLGDVFLSDPRVGSPKLYDCYVLDADGSRASDAPGAVDLRPGQQKVCHGSRTFTQADFEVPDPDTSTAGIDWPNQATATATTPDGTALPALSSSPADGQPAGPTTVRLQPSPDFAMTKSADVSGFTHAGQQITYNISAVNTGNVRLNDVVVSDRIIAPGDLTCVPAQGSSLQPGERMDCTGRYTATVADTQAGSIVNGASASGTDDQGVAHEATATAVVELLYRGATGMVLDKTARPSVVDRAGQQVTYTFTITNLGEAPLDGVVVDDPMLGGAVTSCPATVAAGQVATCTATHTVTQQEVNDGGFSNTATLDATSAGQALEQRSATARVLAQHKPHLALAKSGTPRDGTVDGVGDLVDYTFTVTNDGNVPLTGLQLVDPMPNLSAPTCAAQALQPGEQTTCTATLTVSQEQLNLPSIENRATVTGQDLDGEPTTATATTSVPTTWNPRVLFTKTATPTTITAANQVVQYTFTQRNDGNVTLYGLRLDDSLSARMGTPTCEPAATVLAPGATRTCTASLVTTQADVDAGSIVNNATLSTTLPSGATGPVATDSATVSATQTASLQATKSVDQPTYSHVGQVLNYTITVRNTGTVSAAGVQVGDSLPGLSALACTPELGSTLAAGTSMSCQASYTVTQADLDALRVANVATATAQAPASLGGTITATSPEVVSTAELASRIELSKSADRASIHKAGDKVAYSLRVANTGTSTVHGLQVTDRFTSLGGQAALPVSCPVDTLAPGTATTCTATYTVTQADIDQGRPGAVGLANAATATALDPSGAELSAGSSLLLDVVHEPSATLEKTVQPASYAAPGDELTYTLTTTNTGNVTLQVVELVDAMLSPTDKQALLAQPTCPTSLAPGATSVCTYRHTVTQGEVDLGHTDNTVTLTGRTPTGDLLQLQDSATATAVQSPSLTLSKTASPQQVRTIGEVVTYTFETKNTGNVRLSNVRITDPLPGLSALSCTITATDGSQRPGSGPVSLMPKEVKTCTATRAATAADLDAGSIANTARVTADSPAGSLEPKTAGALVTTTPEPALKVTKQVGQPTYTAVGQPLRYTIVVTNSGNVTASDVRVSDPRADEPPSCTPAQGTPLAAGQQMTCQAVHTTTQADLDNRGVTNVATATATAPGAPDGLSVASNEVTSTAVLQSRLDLVKRANVASIDRAGKVVTYSFAVTNTGNSTLRDLHVDDSLAGVGVPTCPVTTLAPGASTTCTASYTVTQQDLDAARPAQGAGLANTATATATDPAGTTATDTDVAVVTVDHKPAVRLQKSATPASVDAVGQTVTYTLVATNTGNVALTGLQVEDPLVASTLSCPTQEVVPVGGSVTCTATLLTTQHLLDEGTIRNTASVRATDVDGDLTAIGQASHQVDVEQRQEMTFSKQVAPDVVTEVGQAMTYTLVATNKGNVTLNGVQISDPIDGLGTLSCTITSPGGATRPGGGAVDLAPDESTTCTASRVATQQDLDAGSIPNTATASATGPEGPLTDTAGAVADVDPQPALQVTKSVDHSTYTTAGQTLSYDFTITNSGNVSVAGVQLADSLPVSGLSCQPALGSTLAHGQTMSCSARYTVTQADVDRRRITNTATATGTDPKGADVTATSPEVVSTAVLTPRLTVSKVATPQTVSKAGETVAYTFTVANQGNATLSGISLADTFTHGGNGQLSAITCDQAEPRRLAPGQDMVCRATYTVAQADIDQADPVRGLTLNNTVVATATDPSGATVRGRNQAQVGIQRDPALTLVKKADRSSVSAADEQITYRFELTNTGNLTLHQLSLDDPAPGLSGFDCERPLQDDLAPGATLACTATRTVGQDGLDSLVIGNTATASALGPDGRSTVPSEASVEVATDQKPHMVLTKTASTPTVSALGDVVTYTLTMTNDGTVTLSGVTIRDELAGLGALSCELVAADGSRSPTANSATVAPDEALACTATRTTTQADLDAGTINNTAVVSARSPRGALAPVPSEAVVVQAVSTPMVLLAKSVSPVRVAAAGDTLTYSLDITNPGTATLTGLQLEDTMSGLSDLRCDGDLAAPLAPGAALHCFADKVVTAEEMDQERLVNDATVTASSRDRTVTSRASATAIPVHTPRLALDKSHDLATVTKAGERLTYTFTVTNTGNVRVAGLAIVDEMFPGPEAARCEQTSLAVGASTACTATHVVTQADVDRGSITNTAEATAVDPVGGDRVEPGIDTDTTPVDRDASLAITKKARTTTPVTVGQPALFDVVVTNDGNTTVRDVRVSDASPSLEALECTPAQPAVLAPGQKMTCLARVTTLQGDVDMGAVDNTASVDGIGPDGSAVAHAVAMASVRTAPGTADATFVKTADREQVTRAGEVVTYTFTATNTGTLSLYFPLVEDEMPGLSAVSCDNDPEQPLAPGATMRCTATHTVTQAEVDAGRLVNTATFAAMEPPAYGEFERTSTLTLPVAQRPALELTKLADRSSVAAAGDRVLFSFQLRNTGNVGVRDVVLDDQLAGLGDPTCVDGAGEAVRLPASLAPGTGIVCQAGYTVRQSDVDAGSLANTATARGATALGAAVASNASTATVRADRDPSLRMTKAADRTLVEKVGDPVRYTISATNTGNVSITGATITEAMPLEGFGCTPAQGSTLAPGATMTCTGTYATRHTDLDNGQISNRATFAGTGADGTTVSGEATSTVPSLYDPRLSFDKQVTPPSENPDDWHAGQVMTYTFRIANIGNMDAYHIIASDTMRGLGEITCVLDGTGTPVQQDMAVAFRPGMSVTCTAKYTLTQIDVDRGLVTNTASLSAREATGEPFPALSDTVTVRTAVRPQMQVDKSASTGVVDRVGQELVYSFDLYNSGYKTLSGLQVVDELPGLGAIDCEQTAWAPGQTNHCTARYVVTQADLDRGRIDNTVTATARGFLGDLTPEVTDQVTVQALTRPELSLDKSAQTSTVTRAGEVVRFTLVATNTGDVTAHDVSISDPSATITDCDAPVPARLAPGEALHCTAEYTASQDDVDRGRVVNAATASGLDPLERPIDQASASSTVPAQRDSQLVLDKRADREDFSRLGEVVGYTLRATNTGNTTLEQVVVSDPMDGLSALDCTPAAGSSLLPGASMTCTASRPITQADLDAGTLGNRATVRAEAPGGSSQDPGDDVTAADDATLAGRALPAMSLRKSADTASVDSTSDVITYTFVATNTGNVTLHDVLVSDPRTAQGMDEISCPATVLAPSASMTCTATFRPAQIDLDAGSIPNTARVTGVDPFGTTTEPAEASAVVGVEQHPSYQITKTADHTLVSRAGEDVLYTFVGTNTGNVSLHVVEITDPLPGLTQVGADGQSSGVPGLTCYPELPADLPPGDSVVCRSWYTTTQEDLDRGSLNNTATITGRDPQGNPLPPAQDDETIVTVPADARMALSKDADVQRFDAAGQPVTWRLTASNPGNQTLHEVRLVDELEGVGAITCRDSSGTSHDMSTGAVPSLAPGESLECTAPYTTTQADVDRGEVRNVARMLASQGGVELDAVVADKRILAELAPRVSIDKTASPDVVSAVGQEVDYTFTITNSGNTTASQLAFEESMAALDTPECTMDGQPVRTSTDAATRVTSLGALRLEPGRRVVCTARHTTTQADLDAGSIRNRVLLSGQVPNGNPEAPGWLPLPSGDPARPDTSSEVSVPVAADPQVELAKATTATAARTGDVVDYTFTLANRGNVTATVSALSDPLPGLGEVSCDGDVTWPATLAPGASLACRASYTVTAADAEAGLVANTATASVSDPQGSPVRVAASSVVVPVTPSPAARFDKQAELDDANGDQVGSAGETVRYTLTVRNTGDVTLRDLLLDDPMLPQLACAPAQELPLAPGATRTCTGEHVITEQEAAAGELVNVATLQGPQLGRVMAASASTATRPNPAMALDKRAVLDDANGDGLGSVGERVDYTVVLRNTGDVRLDEVTVLDPMLPELECSPAQDQPLRVGDVRTCTGHHVLTEAEVLSGGLTNTATASSPQLAQEVSASVTTATRPGQAASLTKTARLLDASGDGVARAGEVVEYTITVANTGDVTLSGLALGDPMLPQLQCVPEVGSPLAPGATSTCTGRHVVSAAEAASGALRNTATLAGAQLPQPLQATAVVETSTGPVPVPPTPVPPTPVPPVPTPTPVPSEPPVPAPSAGPGTTQPPVAPQPPATVRPTPPAVLADTGSDVSPWHLVIGLLATLSGIMLVALKKKETP